MIKYMVIETWNLFDEFPGSYCPEVTIVASDLSNIQTAEAERTMFLEDNPEVSADNVSVVMYRE